MRRTVQVARDAAFADLVVQDTARASAYTVRVPLTPGQRYYWRVRAEAGGLLSAWSTPQSFTAGTASGTGAPEAAAVFAIRALYPQPVRGQATLQIGMPEAGALRVHLYDLLGRAQAVLFEGPCRGRGTDAHARRVRARAGRLRAPRDAGRPGHHPQPRRRPMRTRLLIAAALALHTGAAAQSPCPAATADLDAGNVRARLYNDGALFWKGGGNVYNVPKALPGRPIVPNSVFSASR